MRLTSAPKAEDVRPLPVLRAALSHVKAHFVENEDFDFANEQLKSKFENSVVLEFLNWIVDSFVLTVSKIGQAFDKTLRFSIFATISFWTFTRLILECC